MEYPYMDCIIGLVVGCHKIVDEALGRRVPAGSPVGR